MFKLIRNRGKVSSNLDDPNDRMQKFCGEKNKRSVAGRGASMHQGVWGRTSTTPPSPPPSLQGSLLRTLAENPKGLFFGSIAIGRSHVSDKDIPREEEPDLRDVGPWVSRSTAWGKSKVRQKTNEVQGILRNSCFKFFVVILRAARHCRKSIRSYSQRSFFAESKYRPPQVPNCGLNLR